MGVKPKTEQEDVYRITVRQLRKAGVLDGKQRSGNVQIGQLNLPFAIKMPVMMLHYSGKVWAILFSRTACHFGGRRWWFLCPTCERRCGVLYIDWGRIACRICCNLTYESRNKPWLAKPLEWFK